MSDGAVEHFRMMARYNTGANDRLYAACAALGDIERRRKRRAFFASIHGTLNHILVGDGIWMARFRGEAVPSTGLDAIVHEDFEALADARRAMDRAIERFFDRASATFYEGSIVYENNEGRRLEDPVPILAAHFFNHQTHHRGQVHDLLSQAGAETPVLDLHRVMRP